MKTIRRLLAVLAVMFWGSAQADYALNLPVGVTETSREIHDLHMLILWICVAIGVVVYGLMTYSIIHHRKSKGAVAAKFHENTKLEILWTVIPFVILFAMAVPATRVMIKAYDASAADMSIKVTGYQWKWRYTYQEEGIDFFSTLDAASNNARQLGSGINPETIPNYLLNVDNPMVIPINKKVRILLTSADVIHAWWIPEFGWKKDAIPGFVTDGWINVEKPGIYRGQCTELCGRDHGFMPIVVVAKTEEEYKAWVREQTANKETKKADANKTYTMPELMAKGKTVYDSNCAACHMPGGEGISGTFPAIKGSPVANGPLAEHIKLVVKGQKAMPAFGGTLAPDELAAVVVYQRNSFGNSKGELVQPADIQKQQ